MYDVRIKPVLNGFVVNVGCQTLVFQSMDILASELKRYQADPEKVEKEYRANAVNKSCGPQPLNYPVPETACQSDNTGMMLR